MGHFLHLNHTTLCLPTFVKMSHCWSFISISTSLFFTTRRSSTKNIFLVVYPHHEECFSNGFSTKSDAEEVDVFPFIVRSYDESVSLASVDIGSCRCDFQAGVVTAVVVVVVVVFDNIVDINVVVLFIIIVLEKQIFDASLAVGHSLWKMTSTSSCRQRRQRWSALLQTGPIKSWCSVNHNCWRFVVDVCQAEIDSLCLMFPLALRGSILWDCVIILKDSSTSVTFFQCFGPQL